MYHLVIILLADIMIICGIALLVFHLSRAVKLTTSAVMWAAQSTSGLPRIGYVQHYHQRFYFDLHML